ncbi:hypothetical protein B0H34DRAFT_625904, partial [Crassisporium funariophilum]
FNCNGWLKITMTDGNSSLAGITITHHRAHCLYINISLTENANTIIKSMIDMPALKAWDSILAQKEQGELTEKQVYALWAHLNKEKWQLNDDQATSAIKLLELKNGHKVEVIPTDPEDGINSVSFTSKGVLDEVGEDIVEVAMDSTWKTNAASYKLYAIV